MIELKNQNLTRQLDLIPIAVLGTRITIIGAGAVGGWTSLVLAKMGFSNITVFDYDVVEVENLNCQLYGPKHLGMQKVQALKELVHELSGTRIEGAGKYVGGAYPGIVISAVDSMLVRSLIWEEHTKAGYLTKAVIDPRMGAETALLYVMDPKAAKDRESYEKTLYTDDEALREPCTRKATAYCALALSGLVAAQVKNLVVEANYSRITQWQIPEAGFMAWKKENGK